MGVDFGEGEGMRVPVVCYITYGHGTGFSSFDLAAVMITRIRKNNDPLRWS